MKNEITKDDIKLCWENESEYIIKRLNGKQTERERQERRFQAACHTMLGLMMSTRLNFASESPEQRRAYLAEAAVEYADALIKELEK